MFLKILIFFLDLKDRINLDKKSKPYLKRLPSSINTSHKKCLSNEELNIVDHSSKKKRKNDKLNRADNKTLEASLQQKLKTREIQVNSKL